MKRLFRQGLTRALIWAALAVWAPVAALACDPWAFRSCPCSSTCGEDYCEQQGQLRSVILDPKTGEILACGYWWARCICGAVACPPSSPLLKVVDSLMGVGIAHAAESRVGSGGAQGDPPEIRVENAHGAFSFVKPSAREQDSAGVGINVGLRDGELVVLGVGEGSPAEKSGLKSGDVVVEVNGKAMRGVALSQAAAELRGKPGTLVVLKVRPADGKKRGKDWKVPLIRQHFMYKEKGESRPAIEVRDFEKAAKAEACQPERNGCLFLVELQGRCYFSCSAGLSK